MQAVSGIGIQSKLSAKQEYTEYKLRVPKNLVKKYNVIKINAPRPIKFEEIKDASMVRKTKKQVYVEDDTPAMPTHGAGSVYNFERKEEARRKRRGYVSKEISKEDLPYALRLGGKGGKRYTGRKEPMEHSAYYILTQCPDGVFEAVPVQAWYNFTPDIDYATLNDEEVEHEFSKRDRTLNHFATKYKLGVQMELDPDSKVKRQDDDHGLVIHDDDLDDGDDDEIGMEGDDDDKNKKKSGKKEQKNLFHGKKKKKGNEDVDAVDSDQEETSEFVESKEVDYMSESSSDDELVEIDDEPDPEKGEKMKAKDELNLFSDSSDEDNEEEQSLNDAGKELNAILKKEAGIESSEDEEGEDEDIDNEYSKSAVFMQGKEGKKKKGRSGSNSGSKPGSRSSTPVQTSDQASDTLTQAAKSLKDGKIGSKRALERSSPSPQTKKQKLGLINMASKRPESPLTAGDKNGPRSGTPSSDGQAITEDAIRKYLSHKPMTTYDLVRKFKTKKTGLTKEQTLKAIATILQKIQYTQEKIDGKLYLSIKSKK